MNYRTAKKYNVVVSQKSTPQSSRTRNAYLSRKTAHELYSPTELWTVGLQPADSDVGWWGYRTQRTDSPPFKWTPVKDNHHGLVGAQVTKHVKPIIIGTVTMPPSLKPAVASAVNKKLIQYHSTELPSLIYDNHTLTFYWEVLSTYAEGDNPQVTGLREGFKLENWVDPFFTGMVKAEGSGAGFAITELWERELYARIRNGQLDINRMLKLATELSVGDSAESVWEKVLEKLREELGPVELEQGQPSKNSKESTRNLPVEHKIVLTRQTKVGRTIDTYKKSDALIDSNEVWTVGLRPVTATFPDSTKAIDMIFYGYRSQMDSSSQWGAVKVQGSFLGARYLAEAETMDLGTATMSPSTKKAVLMAVNRAIKENRYDELPNLLFADHVVTLLRKELSSRSTANPPQVTNLSFDLSNWKNLRNMMLFQLGSAAGFEITKDMKKEWEMYRDAVSKAQ
ncbi:hypothetical protein F5878DRAFT_629094 [Lentinula raphanica]|uniref:Uncharacterized protein n=1 Tax=Lentinula raphanica TaxID=153919 RepID=A0AA38P2C3_9AGAR|nr:hypothetical protein F5878DRAFT_629094 [Lentinula raphanica]